MSWSGGTYTKGNAATGGWTGDAAGGIGIEAGRHDTQDNDFQNGINNCLTKDGQNTPTANLPMGGFKHTGVGSATANDQYAAWAQLRNGTPVYIDTVNNRLGVGTTSPTQKLSVEGNVTAGSTTVAGNYSLKVGSGTASTTNLARYSGANGTGEIRHQGTGTFQIAIEDAASFRVDTNATQRFVIDSAGQVEVGDGTAAAPVLSFLADVDTGIFRPASNVVAISTGGAERLRIDGSGRLGLGTTSPATAIDVQGINDNTSKLSTTRFSADATPVTFSLAKSRGATVGTNTIVASGDGIGAIYFNAANGTGYDTAAAIIALVDGAPSASGDMPGRLVFSTTADGSSTLLERMRIDNAGNVGIGTTAPAYRLQIGTDSAAKPTTNTWTIASDERIKTNIQPYAKGLAEILQVDPITYDYNGKGGIDAGPGGVSIIAQALQPVFPECVGTFMAKLNEEDEQLTELLNYNGHAITFALINAVKELSAKVDALEAQLEAQTEIP